MLSASLDICGLYDFDTRIFNEFHVPENVTFIVPKSFAVPGEATTETVTVNIDKTLVIDNILTECAGLELLYPNPTLLRRAIDRWSAKRLPVWTELLKTTAYNYVPIWNYERREDEITGTELQRNIGETFDGHQKDDIHDVTDNYVQAYNETPLIHSSEIIDQTEADRKTDNQTDTDEHAQTDFDRQFYARGNIGVTSTQELITQQREVVQLSIIDVIIKEFRERFLLEVY